MKRTFSCPAGVRRVLTRVQPGLSFVLLLLILAVQANVARADKRLEVDLDYTSLETETPHTKWAKPYAGGRLKVLALMSGSFQTRDLAELAQRFDFDMRTSLMIPGFGVSTMYAVVDARLNPEHFKTIYSNTLTDGSKYDVILLSGNAWDYLSSDARERLVKQVKNGTGLVWICPKPSSPDGWKLLPVSTWDKLDTVPFADIEPHAFTRRLPKELMPAIHIYKYQFKEALSIDRELEGTGQPPLVLTGKFGDAKVHVLTYSPTYSVTASAAGTRVDSFGLIPSYVKVQPNTQHFPWWDYFYGVIGQAVLDAGGKDTDVSIRKLSTPQRQTVERIAGQIASITIRSDESQDVTLRGRIRNELGQTVHEEERSVKLKEGETRTSIKLPHLTPGEYAVDVLLSGPDGMLDWRSESLSVRGGVRIKQIDLTSDAFSPDQPVTGNVVLTSSRVSDAKMKLQLLDGYGRLLDESVSTVTDGKAPVDMAMHRALGTRGILRATLMQDGQSLDRIEHQFILTAPREWGWFEIMMWQDEPTDIPPHLWDAYFQQMQRMGCTMIVNQYNQQGYTDAFLDANLKMCSRIGGYGKGGLKLTDPESEYSIRYTTDAEHWAKFGPPINMAGDESYADAYEKGKTQMTTEAITAYRNWLKDRYQSIGPLNELWQTSYKTFDEIVPPKLASLQALTGNFAAWSDLKTFVEEVFAYRYETIQKNMLKGDPHSRNSASGTQSAYTVYKSYNWWKLCTSGGFRALMGYGVGDQVRQQYSWMHVPHMFWNGYGKQDERLESSLISIPWRGGDGVGLFAGRLFLNPDFSFNGASRGLLMAEPYLRGPVPRLLYHCEYGFDDLAVHYSQRSTHGAAALGISNEMGSTVSGLARNVLQSLGTESKYVSYEQIEKGELTPEKHKMILMLHSVAISEKEAEQIREYVKAGGIVFADVFPAIMQNNARMLPKGQLDDVFGISRTLPTEAPDEDAVIAMPEQEIIDAPDTPEGNIIVTTPTEGGLDLIEGLEVEEKQPFSIGLPCEAYAPRLTRVHIKESPDTWATPVQSTGNTVGGLKLEMPETLQIMHVDKTVTPTSAKPLAIHTPTKTPLFLANEYGKGLAILVNCDVFAHAAHFRNSRLPDEVREARHNDARNVMRQVVEHAGYKPRALLLDGNGKDIIRQSTVNWVQGPNRYIRPNGYPDTETATLVLADKAHVFNMYSHEYLGHLDRIEFVAKDANPRLAFALLAYRPTGLNLSLAESCKAGESLPIEISFDIEGDVEPGLHVVNVQLTDPTGNVAKHYTLNVECENAKGIATIPFVANDAKGKWMIKAQDAATGLTAEASILVNE